ncbi:DUF3159 domain-containing protein [Mycetocola zhadangensis]|uniref:DUF3159 domain-containing protein n=1 Tax=Mycetocola zhadangensis TaxID=1164595 RepID=A0A3L7J5S1_9MICO|nr:DUF3159 domain-containing protein [Mycetocola zhadangensis]RLQ86068.1 DUF3159 domain-containing protein [Mycetocola zhadangensis]GGE88100.1 hypothetical protein GCM10011313_08460 [Mycetocola zhadangensis]
MPELSDDHVRGTNAGADGAKEAAPQESEAAAAVNAAIAEAARKSGLNVLAQAEKPNGHVLLEAMGGIRGLVEAVVPGLLFLVVYTLSKDLLLSLVVSVGIAAVLTVARLIQKTPVASAVGGLIGAVVSAALALFTGRPEDNFVLGFVTNGAYAAALLVSILVGWPLIGLIAGYLMNDSTAWKKDTVKRRTFALLTLCWAGMFLARLAVQLPLYFSGNVEWLAGTKLFMGLPLYAPMLIVTWLAVRALYRKYPVAS